MSHSVLYIYMYVCVEGSCTTLAYIECTVGMCRYNQMFRPLYVCTYVVSASQVLSFAD